jgi:hypothetical protein
MKKSFLLFFLLICAGASYAQLSFEPRQFIIDFEDYVNQTGTKPAREAMEEFAAYYNASKINNSQKILVVKLSNEFINKNIPANIIENYVKAMAGLIMNNQVGSFDGWMKAAKIASDESKEALGNYMEFSKNVFYEKVLARVGNAVWSIDNMEMVMDLRGGKPNMIFKNTNIICLTPGDTLTILNTTGKFLPATNEWKGNSGMYLWSRVGLDSSTLYATLKSYTINFEQGEVRADTALLSYPSLFTEAVSGTLIDRPFVQSMGVKSTYPKFSSHKRNYRNLPFGQARFSGGFGLTGRVIRGLGSDSAKAELTFFFKARPVLKIRSDEFVVRGDRVATKKAEMSLLLDQDSVFHPQIEFVYRFSDHFVHVFRTNVGVSQAPFYDAYHGMEFYADEIKWKLENPKLDVDMVNDNEPAKFESFNYFRDHRYERIQGILDYNPLQRIKTYVEKNKIKGFYIKDYAANFKSNLSDIKLQMIQLNDLGYISYDSQKEFVTVKRKLYDYVNAHYGRTDYDALAFFSIIKRYPNATISLINNDLQIQGVPKFHFSDSQNVYVVPQDQILNIRKNRGMDFSGKVRAGKTEFFGSGFAFDYTTFQVRLNNVDSMRFYYKDEKTGRDLPIKSVLQDVYGTLSIDHPANKSGRKKIPGYPIFKSDKGSNVFYDKYETQKGVYKRELFYFEVDPFTLDSLTDLDFKTLSLAGTMHAANIVPDFRYTLSLQPDRSFGFLKPTVEEGYPLYGGKGRGFLELALSEEGFFGNGNVRYVASNSESEKFILLIDSMNADVKNFTNDRTGRFPDAIASDVYEHWRPYQDSMYVTPKSGGIFFSKNRAELQGILTITPEKMGGNGNVNIADAQLNSTSFWLQPDNVSADTSTFRVLNKEDANSFSFYTGNVNSNVDLNVRHGRFMYHEQNVNTNFVVNQYVGSFRYFDWLIDERKLDFVSYQKDGKDASYLLSVRKTQDSLQFTTGKSTLDLKEYTLYSQNIPFIRLADAFIYPDSGFATIRKEAAMDMLKNATIVADTVLKFHKIEKSNAQILGRFNLNADGVYQYIDKDKKVQQFYMNVVKVNEQRRLIGKTSIPDSINFYAGTKIRFQGTANLLSIERNLEYEGFFLPIHILDRPKSEWFRNSAIINPDSVYININPDIRNDKRQAMMVGLGVSNDTTHVYPTFFTRKRNATDLELMRVNGILYYDESDKVFKMGNSGRIFYKKFGGNYTELNESKKELYYEGAFNTGTQNGKFEFYTGGKGIFQLKDTSFSMDVMTLMDFPFPNNATKLMFDSINYQSASAEVTKNDLTILSPAITEYLKDEKTREKVIDDLSDNSIRLVNELEKLFLFSNIQFEWNTRSRAFISIGDLSLNSIVKNRVERKLYGRIQITKKRGGDDFVFYFEAPEGTWYYFRYQKGTMYALSSDILFNKYIREDGDKISKKYEDYKLRLANIAERNRLVRTLKTENKQ